jgi:hypothetical protein
MNIKNGLIIVILFKIIYCQENRLYKKLMQNFDAYLRPISLTNSTITEIKFKLELIQVLQLDERHQTLTTNLLINQKWKNPLLKWNKSEFNDIHSIRLSTNDLWIPDTAIANLASSESPSKSQIKSKYLSLNYNGYVSLTETLKIKSACSFNMKYFPFDQQTCLLKFVSLANRDIIKFENNGKKTLNINYQENNGWILLNFGSLSNKHKLSELVYEIQMRRKSVNYVFNAIIPCTMLSILTCLIFWLPSASNNKISLGLSCFVAYSVYAQMISEKLPSTSEEVPIISIYLIFVMILISSSVLCSVIVKHIQNKSIRLSKTFKKLVKNEKILSIFKIPRLESKNTIASQSIRRLKKLLLNEKILDKHKRDELIAFLYVIKLKIESLNEKPLVLKGLIDNFDIRFLNKLIHLPCNKKILKANLKSKKFIREWIILSMIIDRILFLIFMIISTLLSFLTLSIILFGDILFKI